MIVAVIASTPPTLAAMVAFFASRSSARLATQERAASVGQSLDTLEAAVARIESGVERVECGVVELRERVARLEGAQGARPVPASG